MTDDFYSDGSGKSRSKEDRQRDRESEDTDDKEEHEESASRLDVDFETPSLPNINLPLVDYAVLAAKIGHREEPTEHDERYVSTTWEFTRLMKSHPDLINLSADDAFKKIPWGLVDFDEDELLQFLVEWGRVKYLPGQGPLDASLSLAGQKPLVPERCRGGKFSLYATFIGLCGWLQILAGEGHGIYLPVRKTGKLLGCAKEMISTLLALAVTDGFLKIQTQHTAYRATRFIFNVDKFPCLWEYRQ